jgi:hypothetical protein
LARPENKQIGTPILLTKMNFKKYHLFFQIENKFEQLSFNLVDNPLTELWIKNLQEAECKDIIDVQRYFSDEFSNVEDDLKNLVDIISLEVPEILSYWKEPVTQDVMNALHQYFHSSVEHAPVANEKTKEALGNLNLVIHKWEMTQHGNISCVFYRLNSEIRQPLPIELRKYWSIEQQPPGSLTLGYYTIGKELWSCYMNNDMEVVKAKMVQPQMYVPTQVIFDFNPTSLRQSWKQFDQWCTINNTIKYGVHSAMPIHRTAFKPVLGIAEYLPSKDHLKNMWKQASKIIWTLE